MPPTRSDHLENAYPASLRAAEGAAIAQRRGANQIPLDRPLVGVALSGGGIRSATFCLGLFQSLARQRLVRRIDLLSTVSGGGYFGGFLGAGFSRGGSAAEKFEEELGDNHSWSVDWLRNNGRFLSPNGAGDNWIAAAVAVRNWIALHVVMLTFGFSQLALGVLIRADLWNGNHTFKYWQKLEDFWWQHSAFGIWWSPWTVLPALPFVFLLVPTGAVYWLTQFGPLMNTLRKISGIFRAKFKAWTTEEFSGRWEILLTRSFMVGLVLFVGLFFFALVDSLGQTIYLQWSNNHFQFPKLWAGAVAVGGGFYTFGTRIFIFAQNLLGKKKLNVSFNLLSLAFAFAWLLLILVGLSVTACGFAWGWDVPWEGEFPYQMRDDLALTIAVSSALILSWWFSRCFSFVNLSSLQQVYAARLRRAYIGATNPLRRKEENYSMTDLVSGDDFCQGDYAPHAHGGPLHLINVTVNETVSGKTQIERRDRKGLNLAIGPCGLSVGSDSHALWFERPDAEKSTRGRWTEGVWENRKRWVAPIHEKPNHLLVSGKKKHGGKDRHKVEELSVGRWIAISGAAFTTGLGAGTQLGLSLLLGLANVRLGYWWDSGVHPEKQPRTTPPTFIEMWTRVMARCLPVQTCLLSEFFARFHGPSRQFWYLSDGGHFENTACYELIRRRVPFIICSDAGQDAVYQFSDLANLVRKARTDFGAEVEVLHSREYAANDDGASEYPLPKLEDLLHPSMLRIIGSPEDFIAGQSPDADGETASLAPIYAKKHAMLARIRYEDTNEICWMLLIKPSLMGDESVDVVQYHRTHSVFPQEATSDQYFDEAQWESYRKLGEHIGAELFAPQPEPEKGWRPSEFVGPKISRL